MIRWLLENLGLMLLALAIAAAVWVAAAWDRDPFVEQVYSSSVPVTVKNLPAGTYLVDGWQEDLRITLRAPQSVWSRLSPRDIEAFIDLSPDLNPLTPGEYNVPVQVVLNTEPVTLLEVEPEFLTVELEALEERSVPIFIQIRGEPELGYQWESPTVVSDTVKIRGPASRVNQVSHAVASVSLQGARDTVSENASLVPVDAEGRRVTDVEVEPELVEVRVPVEPLPNVKEMSVNLTQLGQPAEGYHVTSVAISPPVVRVLGPVFILDDLPGFLTTAPISIEGRTEDVVERLPLDLPPGVSMFDPKEPAVQVTIAIDPYFDSVAVTRTLTYQGLRPGLVAVSSPETVEVILSGPRPRLSNLAPEDVRVVLDVSGMELRDEAQLEPVVVPPEGTTVESIIPSVIRVQIVAEPTPTAVEPTATPQAQE